MTDLARQLIASQTHRRTIDPLTFAKRRTPFVIVRADPKPEPKKEER